MNERWSETEIDWSNQSQLVVEPVDSQSIFPSPEYHSWIVTELVKEWVRGNLPNNGLVLVPDVPNPPQDRGLIFNSREADDNRPRLLIEYDLPPPKQ